MYQVKPAFWERLKDLEKITRHNYSWAEIGRRMDMSRQSAQVLFTSNVTQKSSTYYATLAKLLDFFESEGMPLTIDELFDVTISESEPSK